MNKRRMYARSSQGFAEKACFGIFMFILMVIFTLCCLTGCGHNMVRVDRGIGMVLRLPLPDGSSIIDLKLGKIDSTTTALRGNSVYTGGSTVDGTVGFGSDSAASGSVGGIVGEHTYFSTGTQLNEGNLKDIFSSADVDSDTKKILANYLLLHAQMQASEAQLKQQETMMKLKAQQEEAATRRAAKQAATTNTTTKTTTTGASEAP